MSSRINVLLVDGESWFATPVVRALARTPVRVHALSPTSRVPLRFSRHIRSFRIYSQTDDASLYRAIDEVTRREPVDLCLAVDEGAIRCLSAAPSDVRGAGHSLLPPVESFDTVVDKWSFAEFLTDCGLPHPSTCLCVPGPAFRQTLHEVAYPLLLKPRRGGNGVGIVRCHHAAEVTAYLDARPHLWNQVVIQTEVAGWDIDCSVLCANGKIVAHTIQRPLVRSSSDFKPAPAVEFIEDEGALSVVGRLMAALGWTGVAHVDMRYDVRGNITILEVNPRFWGSLPGSVQAGVNFPYLAVLLALGRPLPPVRSMPCRYIAGGAAFRALFQGRRPTFRISQTPWLDMVRDPGPTLQELWSAASASVAGR